MKTILIIITCFIVSLAAIKYMSVPFAWVGYIWAIGLLALSLMNIKTTHKIVFTNLGITAFLLASVELYLYAPLSNKVISTGNMWKVEQFKKHDILGYSPPALANKIIGKKYYDNQVVYDTTYSTDHNAQRCTFPRNPNVNKSVLFFGCSITFGDGINDEQTLPYQVGKLSKEKINTYNFGYSGYGPHQMLSALDHDLVDKVILEEPKYAIYSAIPGHIVRSSGLQSWLVTWHDPNYELDKDKHLVYNGHFDDNQVKITLKDRIRAILSNSNILKRVYSPFATNLKRKQNQGDIERYIEIVSNARDIFEQKYPNSEFHVLWWGLLDSYNNDNVVKQVLEKFQQKKLRVHMVEDILPNFYQNNPHYQLVFDSHPTPYANYLLAKYVAEQIIS